MINKKLYFILIIIALIVLVYFIWFSFFSQEAKLRKEFEQQYEKYLTAKNVYEQKMIEDVYGGKTPEETLKLFIQALKEENIELASKYFALETNTQDPDYLTINKWVKFLNEIKNKNLLMKMADDIEKNIKLLSKNDIESSFGLFNDEGVV